MEILIGLEDNGMKWELRLQTKTVDTHSRLQQCDNHIIGVIKQNLRLALKDVSLTVAANSESKTA